MTLSLGIFHIKRQHLVLHSLAIIPYKYKTQLRSKLGHGLEHKTRIDINILTSDNAAAKYVNFVLKSDSAIIISKGRMEYLLWVKMWIKIGYG